LVYDNFILILVYWYNDYLISISYGGIRSLEKPKEATILPLMFILKPTQFGPSESHQLNLLWQQERVWVMDNHRAAMWCWFQALDRSKKYHYLHIDAHYDALAGAVKDFRECQIHLSDITLDHYLKLTSSAGKQSLIRWDNYHPILFECYSDMIEKAYFCTHHMGRNGCAEYIKTWESSDLIREINRHETDGSNWILNIDIDFFFTVGDPKLDLFSEEYVAEFSKWVQKKKEQGAIITFALSPECSGGWERAIAFLQKHFSFLSFQL